jgi:hypothetical protein
MASTGGKSIDPDKREKKRSLKQSSRLGEPKYNLGFKVVCLKLFSLTRVA